MRPTAGRKEWQFLWRRLHTLSLVGRHFGPADVAGSGERAALRHALARRPQASVIFDVGANVGAWTRAARLLCPAAEIHAFEPAHAMFEQLVSTADEHRAHCVNAACGGTPGTATLYSVPGLPGLSSLHERDLSAHALTMAPAEEIAVTTIDVYCAEHAIDHIDYLKIDAEGHELAVLQGAQGMIDGDGVGFIQFEFGGANIDSRTFLRDFVKLLTPRFTIWRLLKNGLEPLVYGEHEEVFVTTNYLAEQR